MPDLCVRYTGFPTGLVLNNHLTTPTPGDGIEVVGIKGLHGRPIRSTIIPRGATDGGRKLISRFGPRLIVVNGIVRIIKTAAVDTNDPGGGIDPGAIGLTAYLTRVNAVLDAWEAALEGALNTPFTLAWTPTGGSGQTLSVTYGFEGGEFEMTTEGENAMIYPTVTFGLVAETG